MDNETKEMNYKVRELFWTGGWDSTFRLVQLSRTYFGPVQPVYIMNKGRLTYKKELEQMETLYKLLIAHPETSCTILPLKVVDREDIPENKEITDAFNKICGEVILGSQYEYLARYAALNPYVELGSVCHEGEFGGLFGIINKYGALKTDGNDSWIVDQEKTSKECSLVFGNFSYPIIKTTEREMASMIKRWNCEDIMSNIWFCHSPIDGQPCGICCPCEQKMGEHMDFLFPSRSKKRYHKMKRIVKIMVKLFGRRGRFLVYRLALFFSHKTKLQ